MKDNFYKFFSILFLLVLASILIFVKNPASAADSYVGTVTYGSSYTFDQNAGDQGASLVSSTNWLSNGSHTAVDYYKYYAGKFDIPNGATVYAGGAMPGASGVYYVNGNLTTSGNWLVPSGRSITIFVNGNLNLGGKINLSSGGFIGFIVNGNIVVPQGVGTTYNSSTPVVEGLYIADGTFSTGLSEVPGAERFVGKGSFIAGNFNLQRDLGGISQNQNASAELFIYNPYLVFGMPETMKDLTISWQEVAP